MFGSNNFQFETPNVIDPGDLPPQRPNGGGGGGSGKGGHRSNSHRNNNSTPDTADTSHESSNGCDPQQQPRLLNDINDLELSPVKPALPRSERLPFRDFPKSQSHKNNSNRAYSPYEDQDDDDDDDEYGGGHHHSLPRTAEDARFHAASLLRAQQQHSTSSPVGSGGSSSAFGNLRTVRLAAPRFAFGGGDLEGGDGGGAGAIKRRNHYLLREVCFYARKYALPALLAVAVLVGAIWGIRAAVGKASGGGSSSGAKFTTVNRDPHRLEQVLDFLAGSKVSTPQLLEKEGSPQRSAAVWMAQQDVLQYAVPLHPSDPSTRFLQRYALAVLYFSTGGGKGRWINNPGFLSDSDECGWNEVVAVEEYLSPEIAMGVSCNEQLRVTSVFLPGNGLTGDLPLELRYLTELQLLGLQFNEITGPVPPLQDALQGLLYVNLYRNNMTGPLPDLFWDDLPHLQVLALGANELTGPVPDSIGRLSKLKTLSLDYNMLTGGLQFARHLPNLEFFYAEDNAFDDTLDRGWFAALPELVELDLSNNQLKGSVPLDLLLVDINLDVLDLAFNDFTGQFPAELTEANYQTHYINLRGNRFSGTLPDNLDGLFALEHLDLHDNQFSGTLPNALGRLADLIYLYVGGTNQFDASQQVPPLSQLLRLRELSMENQGLQGPIPFWIQYLQDLQLLDLSHNALTGAIPDAIWKLPELNFLLLNDNQLSGPLPTVSSKSLSLFALHHNSIQDPNMDAAICQPRPGQSSGNSNKDEEKDQIFATVDCDAGCTTKCCQQKCCAADQVDCHAGVLDYYTDGLDYEAQPFAMDPDILDEAGIIETYPLAEGEDGEVP